MPYRLRLNNALVSLDRGVYIESDDDFAIRINAAFSRNDNYWRAIGGKDKDATYPRVLIFKDGYTRLTDSSNTNHHWDLSYDISAVKVIEFKRKNGALDLYLDGVKQPGTKPNNTSNFYNFKTINANYKGISSYACDYERIEFEVNDVLIRSYQKLTLDNPDDPIFPDTVGTGNDGRVIGDVEWVYYEDAVDVTLDAVVTQPTPSIAGTLSADLPQPELNAVVTQPVPAAAGTLSADLPQPELNAVVTEPLPSIMGTTLVELPDFDFDVIVIPPDEPSPPAQQPSDVITIHLDTHITEPESMTVLTEPYLSTIIVE